MIKIMAVNAGSSSLKFQLLVMPEETVLASGIVERIGNTNANFVLKFNGQKVELNNLDIKDHNKAVDLVLEGLIKHNILTKLEEIKGVGHRIVQGGEFFKDSVILNEEYIKVVEDLSDLAPLHNPAHIIGIRSFQKALPNVPQIGVFDTTFHQTMKPEAYMYALPYEYYEKYKIRKYGAHGTSHQYVSQECAKLLNKNIEDTKIVVCHIGNGASITAVKGGKSVDTSMGLTPLEGIPMGTRSGNIDPTVLEVIAAHEKKDIKDLLQILNRKSGYLGISGRSHDARDIRKGIDEGDFRAKLTFEIQSKRIADYISSYIGYMGGCDAICFTAGIGENVPILRKMIVDRLSYFKAFIDEEKNSKGGDNALITTDDSEIKVFIVPTNEEVVIARDVMRLTNLK